MSYAWRVLCFQFQIFHQSMKSEPKLFSFPVLLVFSRSFPGCMSPGCVYVCVRLPCAIFYSGIIVIRLLQNPLILKGLSSGKQTSDVLVVSSKGRSIKHVELCLLDILPSSELWQHVHVCSSSPHLPSFLWLTSEFVEKKALLTLLFPAVKVPLV